MLFGEIPESKRCVLELMKNVGGKTIKDIGMWKVCPKWVIDGPDSFFCKGSNSTPTGFMFEDYLGTFLASSWIMR